ncbi:zinc finger BED domain-containing protein RICESLEEPER 2-like [Pistacia vera]|uniref:zinc finger BED domain-containing protein RICESLEEPER 2-like n=1 Tax=Pistacia vera TaxID=55513 RepID=UPI001262BA99|nr:zinc finger BED domain-containing protein RICESLEEPER 2-like [Pistacia vera]
MAEQMIPKFTKYWDSYSLVLTIATTLDPRLKFQFVEYAFKKVYDLATTTWKLEVVKNNLQKLFQAYEAQCSKEVPGSPSVVSPASGPTLGTRVDHSFDFDNYESDFISTKKSELDLYLGEMRFDCIKYQNLDILDHWKNNHDR